MAISLTYTFSPGTRIRSAEVNSNFSTLATKALDKTGDTMTGHLLFTDNSYDIGASGATRPRDFYLARNAVIAGTLGVTGVATLTAQAVFNGGATFGDTVLTRPELKDYSETKTAPSISSNILTLDYTLGQVFEVTVDANINTFTISNWPATGKKGSIEVWFKGNGSGFTQSWGSVRWPSDGAPVFTTTNGDYTVCTFHTFDAGSTVFGVPAAFQL